MSSPPEEAMTRFVESCADEGVFDLVEVLKAVRLHTQLHAQVD